MENIILGQCNKRNHSKHRNQNITQQYNTNERNMTHLKLTNKPCAVSGRK